MYNYIIQSKIYGMFYSYILMQIRSLRVSVIVFLSLLWGKNCADLFIGHYF